MRCTAAAGVRVPQPNNCHAGVLLMELVTDANGDAAPRLNDVAFTPAQALAHHTTLIGEVVRMLCAGVVHGDLSEFNILLAHVATDGSAEGTDVPVIIDLPQAIDAAGNNHAQRMLLRDVANLANFFGQFAPALLTTDYGPEIWSLYQAGMLTNETPLTGRFERKHADVDMQAVLREIEDARAEDAARRLRMAAPGA
jgi:RIO kinase 1